MDMISASVGVVSRCSDTSDGRLYMANSSMEQAIALPLPALCLYMKTMRGQDRCVHHGFTQLRAALYFFCGGCRSLPDGLPAYTRLA